MEGVAGFEYIHSSFPEHKHSPEYAISSKMKSSLKLVILFELFEGVVVIFELFDRLSTFWIEIFLVFELVVVFELVIIFELLTGLRLSGSTLIFFVFQLRLSSILLMKCKLT